MRYTRRRWSAWANRLTVGSRWYYGNFQVGVSIDSHPRFFTVSVQLLFFELCAGWTRDAIIDDAVEP